MKRRFISELIAADLNELAYSGSDYIASEESIRFLVDFYNGRGLLTNAIVIHKDQLLAYLHEKISNDPGFLKTEAHYQFFIEVGARSKAQQRTPAAIHYCALDLFISPDSPPFAFVADHYQKFSGYYAEFAQISEKLGIQFLVVGSKDYFQADSVHCPIFTLRHLLLTAHDGHIHNFLKSLVNLQTFPSVVQFDWNSMPPNYVLNSQSFTMLTKYTQSVKDQEGGSLDTPASLLVQHHFDEQISSTLFNDARVNKVRNKSIRYLAAEYAGEAVVALEAQEGYQLESKLIDLCYQTYPLLHSVLRKAFEIQVQEPYFDEKDSPKSEGAHPIFELAFYHAQVLENCLKNPNFHKIFNNDSILMLMQKGFLNPYDLFEAITLKNHDIQIKNAQINIVVANLGACEPLLTCLMQVNGRNPEAVQKEVAQLLVTAKTKAFFQNPELVDLLLHGYLTLAMVAEIFPHRINKLQFSQLQSPEAKMSYLIKEFKFKPDLGREGEGFENLFGNEDFELENEASPKDATAHSKDESDVETGFDDLFEIPKPVSIPSTKPEKPGINVGLLVQSLSSSVFTKPEAKKTNNGQIVEQEEITVTI